MNFPIGVVTPIELEEKLSNVFDLIKPMIAKRKHGSPWFRIKDEHALHYLKPHNFRPEKTIVVLIPGLTDYVAEIYKDLGYDIQVTTTISRKTRRTHFRRIEVWEEKSVG